MQKQMFTLHRLLVGTLQQSHGPNFTKNCEGMLFWQLALFVHTELMPDSYSEIKKKVRAGIVGYPNVGKSSLINRLLKRRICPAAPRPGVTRELKWVRFGKDLELLDSPGIIPMRISDQSAAIKLAICDDIGERSYNIADVAAILVQMLVRIPSVGTKALYNRYKIGTDGQSGQIFVQWGCPPSCFSYPG